MNGLEMVVLVIVALLFAYLLTALLKPEWIS